MSNQSLFYFNDERFIFKFSIDTSLFFNVCYFLFQASIISAQRPGTQFRGGTISTQSRPKTIHPSNYHQSQEVIIQHHPSSPPQTRNVPQFSTFNPYPGRNPGIGTSSSPPPPSTRSSTTTAPSPATRSSAKTAPSQATRSPATTAPTSATRSPALQSRKRSSNPSSPDISKKPTVPEKSANLGKNCIFPRPSKLPIVSMYGASHEVKKVRKTSGDMVYNSSVPGGTGGGNETLRRHELRHQRASPSNVRVGSPKRGDVRRAGSPTLPTWRRSPSSSRSVRLFVLLLYYYLFILETFSVSNCLTVY